MNAASRLIQEVSRAPNGTEGGLAGQEGGEILMWPVDLPSVGELRHKLETHHAIKTSLCAALESLADKLPDDADEKMCIYIGRSITPVIRRAHDFEENVLFPLLRTHAGHFTSLIESIDKLEEEHCEDLSFADEIQDALSSFSGDPNSFNAETLGYMLRGFFENMRRHIEFERIAVISVLSRFES